MTNLGFDPIWFGVMIVLVTQMGVITPPVGVCVYVVSGMERDVPLETIFRGSMPFLAAMVVVAVAADPLSRHCPGPAPLDSSVERRSFCSVAMQSFPL